MKKKTYKKGGHAGMKVVYALLAAMAVILVGALVLTSVILSGKLQEQMISTACAVLLFGATVMGAVIAAAGEDGFWIPLSAYTAIEYLVLVAINIIAFDGGLERIGIGTLAVILGAATALCLKFIPIARPRRQKYKHRFR